MHSYTATNTKEKGAERYLCTLEKLQLTLEGVLQCELDLTLSGVGAVNQTEVCIRNALIWRSQADGVKEIEEVSAELQVAALGDWETLACGHVEVLIAGGTF